MNEVKKKKKKKRKKRKKKKTTLGHLRLKFRLCGCYVASGYRLLLDYSRQLRLSLGTYKFV